MNILWFFAGYFCGLFTPALFLLLLSSHVEITRKESEENSALLWDEERKGL